MAYLKRWVLAGLFALFSVFAFGDVSVTASRAYVNTRTTLHPVTNDYDVVVGYTLGIQSNIVLAASGGGGGGDANMSNVVEQIRAMKPVRLGEYLWEFGTEGEDFAKATNRLAKVYPSYRSGCTGVATTRYHGRNLDWGYNKQASIVVRSPASEGKFACIGMVDGLLTDDFLSSEKWTNAYDSITFSLSDGINDKGVVIQQNVIPTNSASATSAWRTKTGSRFVISFAIVRYVLDRCSTAWEAANMIKDTIFVPSEFMYDFHYLVSDRTSSYVVEDNAIYSADLMTNFRIGGVQTNGNGTVKWNTVETFGIGVERYDRVRTNGYDKTTLAGMVATMKDVWYTKAYQDTTTPYWYTEFCEIGTDRTVMNALNNPSVFDSVKSSEHVAYTNEHDTVSANYRGGHTWQTTHTAIFDKQALTMLLYTQEDPTSERRFRLIKDKWTSDDVAVPEKWALANVTNSTGGVVLATDVGALPVSWTNGETIVAGYEASATSNGYHVAIGYNAQVDAEEDEYSVAVGAWSLAKGESVAIGNAYAESVSSIAIGDGAYASADCSISIGGGAEAECSTAVGNSSYAGDDRSTAIGYNAVSHGEDTVTLGEEGTTLAQVYIGGTSVDAAIKSKVDPIMANTNYTFHIDGTDLIIRTNNVEVWHSWKASQSSGTPVRRYALFLIHLNPNSASHPFADIELKATTNNYYNDSMMFYCASSVNGDPAKGDNPTWDHDWCRLYVLTSKVDSDVRRWRRIRNTTDLGTYNPRELAIIVDPALFRRGQGSDWCCESNDELIWSYVRITASGPEMDEGGTKQLWRPTMPVKWYTSLPAWANQASY